MNVAGPDIITSLQLNHDEAIAKSFRHFCLFAGQIRLQKLSKRRSAAGNGLRNNIILHPRLKFGLMIRACAYFHRFTSMSMAMRLLDILCITRQLFKGLLRGAGASGRAPHEKA